MTIAFWPRLAVVANDVVFANPPGASRPELARAAVVRGGVATWPLLVSRRVVADGIEIEGLDLLLETLPDGRGNWQLAEAGASAGAVAGKGAEASAPVTLAGAEGRSRTRSTVSACSRPPMRGTLPFVSTSRLPSTFVPAIAPAIAPNA